MTDVSVSVSQQQIKQDFYSSVFWKCDFTNAVVLCVFYTVVIKGVIGSDPHVYPLKMPKLLSL